MIMLDYDLIVIFGFIVLGKIFFVVVLVVELNIEIISVDLC